MKVLFLICFSFPCLFLFGNTSQPYSVNEPAVLVFSKTTGFRHSSIKEGKLALIQLGKENGFRVDTTENAGYFTYEILKNYAAVVFLNTTGDIFDTAQKASFQRYIRAGGGFVGIHSATDTEFDWQWYGKLVGGYFANHPPVQEAAILITDKFHISTRHLLEPWIHTDEWYNFKSLNPQVNVLLSLDVSSYRGSKHVEGHPIAWYHEFEGGRAWYTGLGHTNESYSDIKFLQHLLGGILYAGGLEDLLYEKDTD